ncbi:hypothetical protein A2U01_0058685, partial [Trifolium medium]|nr:hypothetical protein [Trifolium medium]
EENWEFEVYNVPGATGPCAWRNSDVILRICWLLQLVPARGAAVSCARRRCFVFLLRAAQLLVDWPARGAVDLTRSA